MTADPLLTVAALAAAVTEPDPPTRLDVRWRLGDPAAGPDEYRAGHLPGAVFVDLDAQLCGPPGRGGRHPLPDPRRLEAVLRAAGVRRDHPVVVYDAGVADPTRLSAARARLAELGVADATPVGAYCGSGVTAAHTVALHRAGRADAALYVGSWSHWLTDPDRPIATGNREQP